MWYQTPCLSLIKISVKPDTHTFHSLGINLTFYQDLTLTDNYGLNRSKATEVFKATKGSYMEAEARHRKKVFRLKIVSRAFYRSDLKRVLRKRRCTFLRTSCNEKDLTIHSHL